MSTKKFRLNVALDRSLYGLLSKIAHQGKISLSQTAGGLIKESLEIYENIHWDKCARERDLFFNRRKATTHEDVWGK